MKACHWRGEGTLGEKGRQQPLLPAPRNGSQTMVSPFLFELFFSQADFLWSHRMGTAAWMLGQNAVLPSVR